MKKFFTLKTLALAATMLLSSQAIMAGDGTKENPYTPAELNAQKEALKASGATVWVRVDLKGLGEDGTKTDNADTDVKNMAGLFGDDKENFVAYSWAILGQLAMEDLTNTKDLLIALTYGTEGHPYGNTTYPQYASNDEPTTEHFSLVEVHNALSLQITSGLRGYHISSSYIVPKNVIAVKVSAGYSTRQDPPAYVNYTNFIGSEAEYVTPKNCALVLMTMGGTATYDFVLTAGLYDQQFSNSNALNPGTQAGVNAGTTNNRARFRFVSDGTRDGFERNSYDNCTVILGSKDEIFLQVNTLETNFWGNWAWETPEKNWITCKGGKYADYKPVYDFVNNNMGLPVGDSQNLNAGDLDGKPVVMGDVTLLINDPEGTKVHSRYFTNNKGTYLNPCKSSVMKLSVPEGKAITAVEFTFQNSQTGLTADCGTYEAGNWTGNASAIYFTAPGARSINTISVTVANATEDTTPDAIKDITTESIESVQKVDAGIFDLSGRRVSKAVRGLYVIGGKKVVVKLCFTREPNKY